MLAEGAKVYNVTQNKYTDLLIMWDFTFSLLCDDSIKKAPPTNLHCLKDGETTLATD